MPRFGIIHDLLCRERITGWEGWRRRELPDRAAVELVHRKLLTIRFGIVSLALNGSGMNQQNYGN
jgi:hypothetical protein